MALFCISCGTGAVKACLQALGGDQFQLSIHKTELLEFFSWFVMTTYSGSLISTSVTPILRQDVNCFNDDCYSLAFGVPGVMLLLSIGKYFIAFFLKCI